MKTYLVKIRQASTAPVTLKVIAACSVDALTAMADMINTGKPASISVRLA